MEKYPSFERVVGKISEEEKTEILERKAETFNDQYFEELEGKEREKTLEELEIIDLVNRATNEVLQEYGGESFDIPAENIHIILEEMWPDKESKSSAFYNTIKQAVAVRDQPAKVVFLKKLFHELLHFKSYKSLQVTDNDQPHLRSYRVGLSVVSRDGEKMYLNIINEAVTEELNKRFVIKLLNNPLVLKEWQQTRSVINKYPNSVTEDDEPLFDDDTYYAKVVNKDTWKDSIGRLFGTTKKPRTIFSERFTYKNERDTLNSLIDRLYEKNLGDFLDREEVFRLFAEGMFSGNLLTVGKLIEKTFGAGTFRKIGELSRDPREQKEFIEALD